MNNTQKQNNINNGQETHKTIHIAVDREYLDKQDALWATESKYTRKTIFVFLGCFLAITVLSGFIPIVGKLPLTPLLVIYLIYRYRKGKELKKRNREELREFQEQLRANKAKTGSNNKFNRSYVTEESYEEYQTRKKTEEEEIMMMQMAYDEEQERLQRMEEEWQAQQQVLFQEIHGDHYDN